MDSSMIEIVLILIIIFVSGVIQGSTGFGFGLVAMGLVSAFLTVKDSTLIVIALITVTSLGIVIKYRKFVLMRETVLILSSALVGNMISFFFVDQFGETLWMKKSLGFVLVGLVVYLFLHRNQNTEFKLLKNRWVVIATGIVGGFIGGAFAVGGPFFVMYFLMRYKDKGSYIANMQAVFIVQNLFILALHGVNGGVNETIIFYVIMGTLIALLGVYAGLKWFERLPRDYIQRIAYVIVTFAGVNLIFFS